MLPGRLVNGLYVRAFFPGEELKIGHAAVVAAARDVGHVGVVDVVHFLIDIHIQFKLFVFIVDAAARFFL